MKERPGAVRIDDFSDPQFPPEIVTLRESVASLADQLRLEREALLADAAAETGLDDFGDPGFEERLDVLLYGLREEAGLSRFGVVGNYTLVRMLLQNRLLIQDLLKRHPEIHEVRIDRPIIIAGQPRTGTTHLHNLISADPALRSLPYWESLEPVPAGGEQPAPGEPDPRLARTAMALDVVNASMPYFKRMHEMTVDHVHEEIQLLAIDFSSMLFETIGLMPTWRDYYLSHDQTPHYEYMKTVLKVLQWLRGGVRWVLKSPQHLEQFRPLTAVFPDATFVVTHRDPVSITASLVTMLAYSARMNVERPDPHAYGRYWSARSEDQLRSCARERDLLPSARSIDVRFHEFMANDVATVERIYGLARQPMTAKSRAAMDAFMVAHPRGKYGAVVYDLAACGVDREERRTALRFYVDRFGVEEEAPSATTSPPPDREIFRYPSQSLEARVSDLLQRMTLEEKVEQMAGAEIGPEGLWRTPANPRLGIPGFKMTDGPRGVGSMTGHATAFPVASARGATFDPDLERRVGEMIGAEVSAKGGNVLLAPTINLVNHPRGGRAQESYGEDPHQVGEMGAAFIEGAQRHVIASAKHLAANNMENNRHRVSVEIDERTLREVYLPHFKRAVDAGVGSIMTAYNRLNGAYCSANSHLVRDILKGEWGFDGFVESDWFFGTRSTVAAALAGLDIEMPSPKFYGAKLIEAVQAGEVPESAIDDSVRRILRATFRFGICDGRAGADPSVVESPEHTRVALEVARKGIVLLRNQRSALPLERTRLGSIVVVGQLADRANIGDHGSSSVRPSRIVTPLAGIRDRAGSVGVELLDSDSPSAAELDRIAAAGAAVVIVGLTADDEGEGQVTTGDRKALELSDAHQRLVLEVARRNPRTIVVLEGGSAIAIETWADTTAAILMAWYPGVEGGHAIADVLFGDVNPSGKLPVTFVRSEAQLPPFKNDCDQVEYGLLHGYRFVDRMGLDPRYPFGFGLSYTRFTCANLRLDAAALRPDGRLRAHVDVTNTGAVSGDEVVQLYVAYPGSRVERPARDLRAFRRVSLAPGETKSVALEVVVKDLAFYDVVAGAWVVEEVAYDVAVGSSSRDLPLKASFSVCSQV